MRRVCTEREIEREKETKHLFEQNPSLRILYIFKTITYVNKQK